MEVFSWPEPVVPVQSLSDSPIVPKRYIKPLQNRPSVAFQSRSDPFNIPIVDLHGLGVDVATHPSTIIAVSKACREWGFFQVVNHGMRLETMRGIAEAWRGFFSLPMEEKLRYSNTPKTYEGYGSRLGVEKSAILDWGDYFFLHLHPLAVKDPNKWPLLPSSCRDIIEEYGEEGKKLYKVLMKVFSAGLGLEPNYLGEKFGGEEYGGTMRVNYYPKCPQPDLTLGFSPHSDPGTVTILLVDKHVKGLQVRHEGAWITVDPVPGSLIINLGDQMQVLTNNIYKSVEHRVLVNSEVERISVVLFFNPKSDLPIGPAVELLAPGSIPEYQPMTYNEYRMFVRTRGANGKMQLDSLKSS